MRKQLLILCFLILVTFTNLECLSESKTRKPHIILVERNPWAMVIGSDSPTFALYDDGFTIFYDKKEGYKSVVLSKKEIKSFKVKKSFYKLKEYYEVIGATDQPDNIICVWNKGQRKMVDVYGFIRPGERNKEFEEEIQHFRNNVPTEFLSLYDKIIKFNHIKSQKWLPERIEVMFWPYEHSPEEPYIWPENWPNIETVGTKKRHKDSYSIYLNSSYYNDLLKILKERKRKQAILMNGRKWAISYRFPFPNEELWMTK